MIIIIIMQFILRHMQCLRRADIFRWHAVTKGIYS